ncbi:hypothetical protein GCM10011351_26820 [Paraliobacillus quinghaiensis]|uniref:Uncharacterized protein n=1 Tax=Paraliobacillus quinghaiensis TaxID=470815 RepID=A0A917WXJ3_9BACI|nr:hypothetical protein [Paraliobacillus quinghaiensis]GGM39310.1 hypothetical protein GCM10011351_26820 [Paraliobacillus quinghaiensis]
MNNNPKYTKAKLIISVIGIIIALVGITFAVLNLRLLNTNGEETSNALVILWSNITILFTNITLFILNLNNYKKSAN